MPFARPYDGAGTGHVHLWSLYKGGVLTPYGVNASGQIVGGLYDPETNVTHAFITNANGAPCGVTGLGTLGIAVNSGSMAKAINDAGRRRRYMAVSQLRFEPSWRSTSTAIVSARWIGWISDSPA